MTDTPSALVRLDGDQNDNWSSSKHAVAILNTESTLHERIAYAWGLANQLQALANSLSLHENPEIRQVVDLFGYQLQPLHAMLQKLGTDTQPCDQT